MMHGCQMILELIGKIAHISATIEEVVTFGLGHTWERGSGMVHLDVVNWSLVNEYECIACSHGCNALSHEYSALSH